MKKTRPTLKKIKIVSKSFFNKNLWDSKRGKREIVRKRQIVHYVACSHFGYSQESTGKELGEYDHATIRYACGVIKDEIKNYPEIKNKVDQFIYKFKSKVYLTSKEKIRMLLKSKTIDINIRIELKNILKDV